VSKDIERLVVTREEAREWGLKTYWTGVACRRNHVAERATGNGVCVECHREHSRCYRARNPELGRESAKHWRANNPERVRESRQRWKRANRDQEREYLKRWRAENSERVRERSKRYRAADPDRARELVRRWKAANPERIRRWYAARPGYHSWGDMVQRCTNPNHHKFALYGGRGVTIHPRYRHGEGRLSGYHYLIADIGPKPGPGYSLDRIDPWGNYEPGNVRWADPETQARNKRSAPPRKREAAS
jgi:hypothetical protein